MISVECESCKASYQLDERRLPAAGIKMRCTKCGSSFMVYPGGAPPGTSDAAASGSPQVVSKRTLIGVAAVPLPPVAAPATSNRTLLGVAAVQVPPAAPRPPATSAADDPDIDLPAPRAAVRVPFARPVAPPVAAKPVPTPYVPKPPSPAPSDDLDVDLPALAAPRSGARPVVAPVPASPTMSAKTRAVQPRDVAPPAPVPVVNDDLDVDLPALRGAAKPVAPAPSLSSGDMDLDLPALRGPAKPVASAPSLSSGDMDLDLPALRGAAKPVASAPSLSSGDMDLDLPALRGAAKPVAPAPSLSSGDMDLDLPAPRAAASTPASGGDELMVKHKAGEALRAADAAFGDLDLPMPSSSGGMDVELKSSSFGDLDLPQVRSESTDLPQLRANSPFGDLDLPVARGAADLPTPKVGGSLGIVDLPTPKVDADLPVVRGGLDLPTPRRRDEPVESLPPEGVGDEVDLGAGGASGAEALRSRDGKRGVGGSAFGELDLGGEGGAGEEMEFGDLPQAPAGSASTARDSLGVGDPSTDRARDAAAKRRQKADKDHASAGPKSRGRGLVIAVGVLLLLAGGGASLGATRFGFFGIYALEAFLPAAGDAPRARAAITAAERLLAKDTYSDARAALAQLAAARRSMGLNRALLARSALHEALYQQRYGTDSASSSRMSAIFARLDERSVHDEGVPLARAADALLRSDVAGAQRALGSASTSTDAFAEILVGELVLARDAAPAAVTAFRSALAHGGGARAQWGLARALLASHSAQAAAAVDATLVAAPGHIDARTAKARAAALAGQTSAAIQLLEEAAGLALVGGVRLPSSARERVEALALLGAVQEHRGHTREAGAAYEAALRLAPQRVDALLGAGRVLFSQQHYADALARFEAALGATPPESVTPGGAAPRTGERSAAEEAKLGAAQAMLHLDRAREAKTALTALVLGRPADAEVLLALGRAEDVLNDQAAAEQHFREAVRAAPERFEGYIALARLFNKTGRASDATAFLEEAGRRVPQTAEVRRLLGESELEQNRIPQAIVHFRAALELAPQDDGAAFGLGVSLRRAGQLVEAATIFDSLAQRDAEYSGLSLERGMVYEAQGESVRAARMYEAALRARPDDPDLLLRLGASQVAAGQIDAAEQTLARVASARPNSAEAAHFMGRVAFARGNTQAAQQHFDRAVALDGTRGEFHLYAGWAALDSGNFGKALEQVDAAIERDPSLGDAYWIRGEVRLRSGAVQEALDDMEKALALKPGRYEAWAGAAECYDQLRRRPDAIRAYGSALAGDANNGAWWYRLGRLQLDDDRAADARTSLSRAVLLGEAMDARPGWLPDAHRLLGETLRLGGDRNAALEHLRRYLAIAGPGAIDREDVEQQVARLQGQ